MVLNSLTLGTFEPPSDYCLTLQGNDPAQGLWGKKQGRQAFAGPAAVCPGFWSPVGGGDVHHLPPLASANLPDLSPSPLYPPPPLFPTVHGKKRKLRAEPGAARNSIWCLSVSAVRASKAGDAVRSPARKCHPSSTHPKQRPPQAGSPWSSCIGGVEGKRGLGPRLVSLESGPAVERPAENSLDRLRV